MPHALIVVPTYNERDNVRAIAERLLAALPGARRPVRRRQLARRHRRAARRDRRGRPARPRACTAPASSASAPPTSRASAGGSPAATSTCSRWTPTAATIRSTCRQMLALAEDGADVGDRLALRPRRRHRELGHRPPAHLAAAAGCTRARSSAIDVRDVTAGFICWRRGALEAIDLSTITLERLQLPDRDEVPRASSAACSSSRRRSCSSIGASDSRRCPARSAGRRRGRGEDGSGINGDHGS